MEDGTNRLRDRMLRDAIVEVLRGAFDPSGEGNDISLIDNGFVRDVVVERDRARVELVLTSAWRRFSGSIVTEVRRRVQSLPEVTQSEVDVTWDEAPSATTSVGSN